MLRLEAEVRGKIKPSPHVKFLVIYVEIKEN